MAKEQQKSPSLRKDGDSAQATDSAEEQRKAAQVSDAEIDRVSQTTADILASQPKRKVRLYQVPRGSAERKLPDEVVVVNGYSYQIKRGEEVEVPETVAEILEQADRR